MGFFVGALCVILLTVLVVQVGKARELASELRADASEEYEVNKFQAGLGVLFVVSFLVACVISFIYYIPTSLGWGPNTAASEHGTEVDYLFNLTLFFTSIVFFLTQFLLFWFAWKYRGQKGKKAIYWAHNETLEMVWMIVPSVVMTFLVVGGLQAWNNIMTDLPSDAVSVVLPNDDKEEEFIEIEATGSQFLWFLRYPGRYGQIGPKYFTQINGSNPVGQTWEDERNIDDFMTTQIVLPVGKKVRVRITARDVLHNFYIRDMRVKMDAVPGMPTYFIFTPTVTTDSMRRRLSARAEWQVADKNDATKQRWETFNYELACAELCGRGHYSMRNLVKIVEVDEYLAWIDQQEGGELEETTLTDGTTKLVLKDKSIKSQYFSKVYQTEKDPFTKASIEDLEALVTNKLLVKRSLAQAITQRASIDDEYSTEYEAATNVVSEMRELLNQAIISVDVAESTSLVEKAETLALSLKKEPSVEIPVETVDSTTATVNL